MCAWFVSGVGCCNNIFFSILSKITSLSSHAKFNVVSFFFYVVSSAVLAYLNKTLCFSTLILSPTNFMSDTLSKKKTEKTNKFILVDCDRNRNAVNKERKNNKLCV